VIEYDPFGNQRTKQVGGFLIVGNSSMATVCTSGVIRSAVKEFDNQDENDYETSAYGRAEKWARDNQDKVPHNPLGF
jgi:hypothetical protein